MKLIAILLSLCFSTSLLSQNNPPSSQDLEDRLGQIMLGYELGEKSIEVSDKQYVRTNVDDAVFVPYKSSDAKELKKGDILELDWVSADGIFVHAKSGVLVSSEVDIVRHYVWKESCKDRYTGMTIDCIYQGYYTLREWAKARKEDSRMELQDHSTPKFDFSR